MSDQPPATQADADLTQPFGAFAPRGVIACWIGLTRHSFLGHGWFRKKAWRVLEKRPQRCYDLVVRGMKMRLFPFNGTVERKLIFRPDRYCGEEIAFLERVLSGGGTYIDIGANVGALTLPIAKLPNVRVIAVEPGPVAVARLRFNLKANGLERVAVEEVAVSDGVGEVEFTSDERDIKYSGISGVGRWAQGNVLRIPTKPLVDIAAEHGFERIDALKIDVEGHEDVVLLSFFDKAPRSLWPRHVIIEAIEREGLPDCITRMHEMGYRNVFQTRANLGLSLEG